MSLGVEAAAGFGFLTGFFRATVFAVIAGPRNTTTAETTTKNIVNVFFIVIIIQHLSISHDFKVVESHKRDALHCY